MLAKINQLFAANAVYSFGAGGTRYFRCTTGAATFALRGWDILGNLVVDLANFQAGLQAGPFPVDVTKIEITNGATQQTIEFTYGDTAIDDNRLVGNVSITGGIATKVGGDTLASEGQIGAGTVASQIWAAAVNPASGFVQNLGADDAYLGTTAGVTTATGKLLPKASGGLPSYIDWPAGLPLFAITPSVSTVLGYFQARWA